MAIDKEKYIRKYVDEGLENITLVETLIFDIKDGVSIEDDLATLLRALHTLKGSSRMLEFKRIEELTHSMESVFVAFREQRIGLSENAVKLVLSAIDLLKSGLETVRQTKEDSVDIQEHSKNLSLLAANEDFSIPKKDDTRDKNLNLFPQETAAASKNTESENIKAKSDREARKENKSESIRLPIEKINGIIKSIASLQSLEISAKSISQNSVVLNTMIKEHSQILKEYKKREPALAANFRKLERLGEKLNSSLRNYAIDAGNHIRGAYDSVISLRTLPLSTIFDSYPRYVYQLSDELGKKVHLTIEGKENEIDKNIIESLSEVFLHMVRNSIDHGIETPQERIAAGKTEAGNLSIVCSRESGNMKIVISDDGLGIDHEKIRQKAVREGFVTETAAASLSREELTNFIFQSRSLFPTTGSALTTKK